MNRIDYHIHTEYCGHTDPDLSIENIIKEAESQELKAIAITEHSFEWKVSQSEKIRLILDNVKNIKTDICVYVGMEICPDFKNEGRLIFEDFQKGLLSPVLVGTHVFPILNTGWHIKINLTANEKNKIYSKWFRTMEKVLHNPLVEVIAHPGRMIMQNGIIKEFDLNVLKDFADLFDGARENNIAVELNENLFKRCPTEKIRESYPDLIRLALEKGLKLSIGSDAHKLKEIGRMEQVEAILKRFNITKKNLFHPINKGGK